MVNTQYPVYKIHGTHNVRDLGGYRTKSGKITKTQQFIRSDSLHRIGDEGINYLIKKNLKTVILAGGKGTRLKEETEITPKPMVKIGNIPIIEHIMNIYVKNGFDTFIIAAGYKGEIIKN